MANKNNKEKMKFSKKAILVMFISVIVFVVVMIIAFFIKGDVPDELIIQFFGFWGIEGSALGIIKVADTIAEKYDHKPKSTSKK